MMERKHGRETSIIALLRKILHLYNTLECFEHVRSVEVVRALIDAAAALTDEATWCVHVCPLLIARMGHSKAETARRQAETGAKRDGLGMSRTLEAESSAIFHCLETSFSATPQLFDAFMEGFIKQPAVPQVLYEEGLRWGSLTEQDFLIGTLGNGSIVSVEVRSNSYFPSECMTLVVSSFSPSHHQIAILTSLALLICIPDAVGQTVYENG